MKWATKDKDLRLGQIVYILVFITFVFLASSSGRFPGQFNVLLRDSENDLLVMNSAQIMELTQTLAHKELIILNILKYKYGVNQYREQKQLHIFKKRKARAEEASYQWIFLCSTFRI